MAFAIEEGVCLRRSAAWSKNMSVGQEKEREAVNKRWERATNRSIGRCGNGAGGHSLVVMAIDETKWIHDSQDAPEEEDRPAVLCVVA